MKESPQTKKLEEMLRSSKLSASGFMGTDSRSITEIIDDDLATVTSLGFTTEMIASRMRQITQIATPALGSPVNIDDYLQAAVDEAKGKIICPWPHPSWFDKRITTVKFLDTGQTIKWSDLNIHLIEEHCFFEGKGSSFRVEPKEIVKIMPPL